MMRLSMLLTLSVILCGCRLFSRPADYMSDPLVQRIMQGAAVKDVRYKGKIWRVCMGSSTIAATVGETMYIEEEVWKKSIAEKKIIYLRSIIAHESTHTTRQMQMGILPWMISYFTSSSFRWEEEKIAYEVGWRVEVAGGIFYTYTDYVIFANNVSSSTYHGMVDYETAFNFIKDAMAKLEKELKK